MASAGTAVRPTWGHGWQRIAAAGVVAVSLVGIGFAAGRTSTATPASVAPASSERVALSIQLPDPATLAFDRTQRVKWG